FGVAIGVLPDRPLGADSPIIAPSPFRAAGCFETPGNPTAERSCRDARSPIETIRRSRFAVFGHSKPKTDGGDHASVFGRKTRRFRRSLKTPSPTIERG